MMKMVAAGRRSQGCRTCIRRRVKCDEKDPVCVRCTKGNFLCEGYDRNLKFVDEKSKAQRRVAIRREEYLTGVREEKARRITRQLRGSCKPPPYCTPPPELGLKAFRGNVEFSYTVHNISAGIEELLPSSWCAEYISGVLNNDNATSTYALLALSGAFFGRAHAQKESIESARELYTKALQSLSRDIKDPKTLFEIATLGSTLVLANYEAIISPDKAAYIQHISAGTRKLMQVRGPHRFMTQPEIATMDLSRIGIIYEDIERRQRSFLEEREWLTVPWAICPEAKTLMSQLLDIMCFIPGMLEDMDALGAGERFSAADVERLCTSVYTRLRMVYEWRSYWEATNPNCCYEKKNTDPAVPFLKTLHFTILCRSIELLHYNTILLILLRIGRLLLGLAFDPYTIAQSVHVVRTNPCLLLPGDPRTLQDIAIEIVRTCEYNLQDDHRHPGSYNLIYPLRCAHELFRENGVEWEYIARVYQHIANRGCYEISRCMQPGLVRRLLNDESYNLMEEV